MNVTGISTFGGNLDINADIDVDGHTNLDNLSVAGVSTFIGEIHGDGQRLGSLTNSKRVSGLFLTNGSSYYGAVIENMPLLESFVDENQVMRFKLITLGKNTTPEPGKFS